MSEELIKSLEPQLTTLSDKSTRDRPVKRRAIEFIKKETLQSKLPSSTIRDLLEAFHKSFFVCGESDIEYVREQTVVMLEELIKQCEEEKIEKSVIENVLNQAAKRMAEEETEEIRVGWMNVVIKLLEKLKGTNVTVTEGEAFMKLIQISGEDPFPEILKQCGKLILLYSQTQSKSVDYACDRMVRLLFPLLTHKHTAVRVIGIKATEGVLKASPKGMYLLFEFDNKLGREPLIPGLIYDPSALVRDTLFMVLSNLLCDWPPRFRYQYGGKLLPVILSGKFDELPSVQTTCKSSLMKVSKSCVQDLMEADIIKEVPENEEEIELLGLKHLVHICYDESVLYLLGQIATNFIEVRQDVSLKSLQVFLEMSKPDDLVKCIKKLVEYLFIAYANTENQKVLQCLEIIAKNLPSVDIYLEVLLARLDYKYLMNEKNGYQGAVTVAVVLAFLNHLIDRVPLSELSQQKILNTIEKPYLLQFTTKAILETAIIKLK